MSGEIKVLDLFCGTGALSFGLAGADPRFRVVSAVDLDAVACKTAELNHPEAQVLNRPIEDVDADFLASETGIRGVDLIVGGPPCQGFTSLRPSRGTTLEDPRNRLYCEYQRLVGELLPSAFLLENVVGMVNATGGTLLRDLVSGFERLGYRTDWRILNAANFGIPQKRERFFLLGVRSDVSPDREIAFPKPTHYFNGRTIGLRTQRRMITNEENGRPATTAWDAISDLPSISSGGKSDCYESTPLNAYQRQMRRASKSPSLHVAASHNAKMLKVIRHAGASKSALPDGLVSSGYSSCYSRIDPGEPAPTITVKFTSPASSKCIHPFDDRAITPREAARIQSFPDRFLFAGTKTQIAAQLGNAVPPLLSASFAPIIVDLVARQAGPPSHDRKS